MGRIFILGMSPLPFENDRKVYGTGIRTWQFVQPLLDAGHEICLASYAIPSAYDKDFKSEHRKNFVYGKYRFDYHLLAANEFNDPGTLLSIKRGFEPDCVMGCSFYPSYLASKIKDDLPFWADLFGHVMAEAQARAYIDGDDSCLFHYWNSEFNIINTADMFSCVSGRQEYALIGELGAIGRLNRWTAGYEFTCTVPCGMPPQDYIHHKKVIRGVEGVGRKDPVVLWTGGYNTWTDVDTLFAALESAMDKNPSLKFVSTGGEIPEQDTVTYPRFLSMINSSKHKKNYIMKGWIKGEDVPNYYFEADAGINIDKNIYEVRLGSKNRILDWMRAGLCVLSSNVCELTQIIEDLELGWTFRAHDPDDLASKLLYIADNRSEAGKRGERGRKYGRDHFNFARTTETVRLWAEKPFHAPDFRKPRKIIFDKEEALKNMEVIAGQQKEMIASRDKRIEELQAFRDRKFGYRAYHYLKAAARKFKR